VLVQLCVTARYSFLSVFVITSQSLCRIHEIYVLISRTRPLYFSLCVTEEPVPSAARDIITQLPWCHGNCRVSQVRWCRDNRLPSGVLYRPHSGSVFLFGQFTRKWAYGSPVSVRLSPGFAAETAGGFSREHRVFHFLISYHHTMRTWRPCGQLQ
jgi:hypothetical protein